jgi:Zn-dependent protease with chaperone function
MEYKVDKMENVYFYIKIGLSIFVFGFICWIFSLLAGFEYSTNASIITFFVYIIIIILFFVFQKIFLVGYLKGNGIQISNRQFPEVYEIYKDIVNKLEIKKEPKLFLIQEGGMLNAFAVRYSGRNYIAIYSDVFSLISKDMNTVKFILGHELGHVKRNHMSKRFWTCLSSIIPFISVVYSRKCEYTCDNIGFIFCKEQPYNGLVLLAAGKQVYQSVDIKNYIEDSKQNATFIVKFTGLFYGHPYLPKRIENLKRVYHIE